MITYINPSAIQDDSINIEKLDSELKENIQNISNKIDKVDGKGLSTNDYTTAEKNKLAGIASGAEVNVQSDWNETSTSSDAYIKNKPTIPTSLKNPNALSFGSKTYDGSSAQTITASDFGLDSALKFHGTSTTEIKDGSTTKTVTLSTGASHTAENGCVLFYGNKEFIWNGSSWEEFGNEGDYKVKQTAVTSPAASGSTTAFIDTISQDTNGNITVTKKNVSFPTSLPASDVYAWAKASSKPTYTKSEVGLGNVDNTADSAKSVKSAAQLTTARTIWGQSFNGTGNVSGSMTGVTDITMSGAVKMGSGAAIISYDSTQKCIKFTF